MAMPGLAPGMPSLAVMRGRPLVLYGGLAASV
jgi:hypothetical protein